MPRSQQNKKRKKSGHEGRILKQQRILKDEAKKCSKLDFFLKRKESGSKTGSDKDQLENESGSEKGATGHENDINQSDIDSENEINKTTETAENEPKEDGKTKTISRPSFDPVNFIGKTLSDDEKWTFINVEPDYNITYTSVNPKTKGRVFVYPPKAKRPWVRYSPEKDAIFCSTCICFDRKEHSKLATDGCDKWRKLGSKVEKHEKSKIHQVAGAREESFRQTFDRPETAINAQLAKIHSKEHERLKHGVLSIIDIVLVLGQRGIPFRGNWVCGKEDGNFDFFIHWKAQYDDKLKYHLMNAPGNAKYTAPIIQNEIIEISERLIRKKIVAAITDEWSLIADETTDCAGIEQMSICVRYFDDEKGEVKEDFLGFVPLTKMDARTIADALLSHCHEWGLDMDKMVAQSYDGASVMSSGDNGVHGIIIRLYPNATYVHCRAHVLNLVISSSCTKVPAVRNVFDTLTKLTNFIGASAKRRAIFFEAAGKSPDDDTVEMLTVTIDRWTADDDPSISSLQRGSNKQSVPKFCATRWSARVETVSALIAKYATTLDALTEIEKQSTGDARTNAYTYRRILEDPQFIVGLVVVQKVLSYLAPVTKNLQSRECDLVAAYNDIKLVEKCLERDRTSDSDWDKIWHRISVIGDAAETTISKPRVAGRQTNRANAGAMDQSQSASDYCRLNVYYPFIDYVIVQLKERFADFHVGLIATQYLLPENTQHLTDEVKQTIFSYYSKYLSAEEKRYFDCECSKWQVLHETSLNIGQTPIQTLHMCSKQSFPVIRRIIRIFITTPVGSVACERSFSDLRRLKLWLRSSMSERRLNGLAMLNAHRHYGDRIPTPIDVFKQKTNWRFEK